MASTIARIKWTFYGGNIATGDVTEEQAKRYVDAFEAALVEAYPDADIDVTLEMDMEGYPPAQFVDAADEEEALEEIAQIGQRIWEEGAWA